jgi:hypothetical protein
MFRSFTGRRSIFRIFPAELRAAEYGQAGFGTLPLKLQDKGWMKAGCYVRRGQTEIAQPEVLLAFPVLALFFLERCYIIVDFVPSLKN